MPAAVTPGKLKAWLERSRTSADWLRLVHERVEGELVIAQWSQADVFAGLRGESQAPAIAPLILDTAQDHADSIGEACRFSIQWLAEGGRIIATFPYRAAPVQSDMPDGLRADQVTGNAMTATLLRHIEIQQATLIKALTPIMQAYDRTLQMQNAALERAYTLLQQQATPTEASEEERAEAAARTEAWRKLVDMGPDVAQLGILAARRALGGAPPGDDPQ